MNLSNWSEDETIDIEDVAGGDLVFGSDEVIRDGGWTTRILHWPRYHPGVVDGGIRCCTCIRKSDRIWETVAAFSKNKDWWALLG